MIRNNMAHQRFNVGGIFSRCEGRLGRDLFTIGGTRFNGLVRSALFYSMLITVLCLYFAHTRDVSYRLVVCSMVPGLVLGFSLAVLERGLVAARKWLGGQMNGLQSGFLLFFAYLIGYILFSSLFLSLPVGWAMEHVFGKPSLCKEFALFSTNYFIVLALASWLSYLRTALRGTNQPGNAS